MPGSGLRARKVFEQRAWYTFYVPCLTMANAGGGSVDGAALTILGRWSHASWAFLGGLSIVLVACGGGSVDAPPVL